MQRDAFFAGIIVLVVGVVLISISQLPKTEIRDRHVVDQIVHIPQGEMSFDANLESNTLYHLSIKGGLIAPYDPIEIDVLAPDNSSFHIEFPTEDPNFEFQTLGSTGYHNFTFESAYASTNTRAEISKIISWETITHPYAHLLYVGIAFVIVGTAFTIIGWIYPRKPHHRSGRKRIKKNRHNRFKAHLSYNLHHLWNTGHSVRGTSTMDSGTIPNNLGNTLANGLP